MLNRFRVSIFILIFVFLSSSGSHSAENYLTEIMRKIPDSAAEEFLQSSLKEIHKLDCKGEKSCVAAGADELKNPPVSIDDSRNAMAHGTISALSISCGLDYKRGAMQLFAFATNEKKMNERQLRLLSVIHTSFMAAQLRGLKRQGVPCREQLKSELDRTLPKLK